MPDPFNITQVDIPGIYGAVQSARMGRIQQLLGQRQLDAANLQAERDNQIHGILARAYGGAQAAQAAPAPAGGSTAAPAAPAAPAPLPPTSGATPSVTPQGLPGADPSGAVAPNGFRIPPQLAQQLIAAGPEGQQMLHSINTMSDEQLASAQHRLQALAPLYARAASIPYAPDNGAARRAFIHSVLPEIQSMGIDPQQAIGWDPTDEALNAHMSFGQTTNDALEAARTHPTIMHPGDVAYDLNAPTDPRTGQPPILAQSPLVPGPNGAVYLRPDAMNMTLPQPHSPEEARALPPGTRFRLPDGTVGTVPGGPTPPASGTFPRQDGGAFDFRVHPASP